MHSKIAALPLTLIGAFSVLCVPTWGQTKPASLSIGGYEVSIGMPADRTIATLRASFRVEPAGELPFHKGSGSWAVLPKEENSPVFAYINVVRNVVVGAQYLVFARELTTAQDAVEALAEVSSKLEKEHRDSCRIQTTFRATPVGMAKSGLNLFCGDYQIWLYRVRSKSGTGPD